MRQTLVKGLKSILSFLKNLVRPESKRLSDRQNPVPITPSASVKLQSSDISQPTDARLQWGTETLMARGYSKQEAEKAVNHLADRSNGSLSKFHRYISDETYKDGRQEDFQWAISSLRTKGYSPASARDTGHMALAWAKQTGGDMRTYISQLPERVLQFDDQIHQFQKFMYLLNKKGYTPNDAKYAVLQAMHECKGDFSSIHKRLKKAPVAAPDSIKPRPDLQKQFVTTTVIPWMEDAFRGLDYSPEEIHSTTRTLIANSGGPERGDLHMMLSGTKNLTRGDDPESEISDKVREAALETMGLPFSASSSDISRAYRKAALKYHPDKVPDPDGSRAETFRKIQEAYERLTDKT
ncbi:J domain-containing protein [Endozoicomonadaceae bacterium StTr2]